MLLLNACNEASERLVAYDYADDEISRELDELLRIPLLCGGCVGAAQSNLRRHATMQAGAGLWQARLRARDLMRIMNCVQCSVCRSRRAAGARARRARARVGVLRVADPPVPPAFACPLRAVLAGCTARWARSA